MTGSNTQVATTSQEEQHSPFIVQRNPGLIANNRVARKNRIPGPGRRYEVLERGNSTWFLLTVLTVIDGGRQH